MAAIEASAEADGADDEVADELELLFLELPQAGKMSSAALAAPMATSRTGRMGWGTKAASLILDPGT
jgi:hypothetical protein